MYRRNRDDTLEEKKEKAIKEQLQEWTVDWMSRNQRAIDRISKLSRKGKKPK